jgi:hypothetical protein
LQAIITANDLLRFDHVALEASGSRVLYPTARRRVKPFPGFFPGPETVLSFGVDDRPNADNMIHAPFLKMIDVERI